MGAIEAELFGSVLLALLDETFEQVQGFYLDRGTSLFETLAGISAEKASVPVGGQCATLAAQVAHITFYLEVLERVIREKSFGRADWGDVWRTVSSVTPVEWETSKRKLRTAYDRVRRQVQEPRGWSSEQELGGALGVLAHTAYHLGEIRQALCTLKP